MGWQDRAYNRGDELRPRLSFPGLSPLTIGIFTACLLSFLFLNVAGVRGFSWGVLTFRQGLALYEPWRWVTYQYLHENAGHLFFNMLALYFFLPPLEQRWGWRNTLVFYTLGGIAAGAAYGLIALARPSGGLIGASGSIFALLGACAYLYPEMRIFFYVPIRVFTLIVAVFYLLTVMGEGNMSNVAHLGGMAFGFVAPWYGGAAWSRMLRRWHLRRVRRMTVEEEVEQEEVDRILQKVHASGMHSLTWLERRALRRATERQRQRDLELTRRKDF